MPGFGGPLVPAPGGRRIIVFKQHAEVEHRIPVAGLCRRLVARTLVGFVVHAGTVGHLRAGRGSAPRRAALV